MQPITSAPDAALQKSRLSQYGGPAAALVALVASAWFAQGSDEFPLDDAYIHLAYAKSIRLGEGFGYNPRDWELGSTSPLWALMLTPFAAADRVVLWLSVLGGLLHGATALLTGRLARVLSVQQGSSPYYADLAAGIAALMVALHPILLQGAISGMELPLATLLLVSVTLCLVDGQVVQGNRIRS